MTKTITLYKKDFEKRGALDLWSDICEQCDVNSLVDKIEIADPKHIYHGYEKATLEMFDESKKTENKKSALNPEKAKQLAFDLTKANYPIIELNGEEEEVKFPDDDEKEKEPDPEIEKPEDNILTDEEKEHADIMEKLAKKCYSKKKIGFTETEKLEAIEKELEGSAFKRVKSTDNHFSLWAQTTFRNCDKTKPIFLVTSHADNVSAITTPSSKVSKDGWFYHGTYDNLGTNAASVILMKEHKMPDNILFAFTANEENGKCTGLKHIVEQLWNSGYEKICGIALDVTYEGFDEGYLYSLENASNESFIESISKAVMNMEPKNRTFSFTALDKNNIPANLPQKYLSTDYGWFDEAMAFAKLGVPACSFCLPSDGQMHGNSGLDVRQATFEGYLLSLTSFIYSMTGTYENLIETYKEKRNALAEKNQIMISYEAEVAKHNKSIFSYMSTPATYAGEDYSWEHSDSYGYDPEEDYDAEFEAYMEQQMYEYDCAFQRFGSEHGKKDLDKLEEFMDSINDDLNECASYGYVPGVEEYIKQNTIGTKYEKDENVAAMIKASYYMMFPDEFMQDYGISNDYYDDSDVPFDDD